MKSAINLYKRESGRISDEKFIKIINEMFEFLPNYIIQTRQKLWLPQRMGIMKYDKQSSSVVYKPTQYFKNLKITQNENKKIKTVI